MLIQAITISSNSSFLEIATAIGHKPSKPVFLLHLAKDQKKWIAAFSGEVTKLHISEPFFIRRF